MKKLIMIGLSILIVGFIVFGFYFMDKSFTENPYIMCVRENNSNYKSITHAQFKCCEQQEGIMYGENCIIPS